ncbi:MAG: DUF2071 domain-containing protein [Acidobacteria bacterium]|nr:DUF2071 domain-containing protein [Acidobacteriota bacterium]
MPDLGAIPVEHRPLPVPDRPWAGRMSWRDLLFAHWPIPASALRPHVPAALEIEEFRGTAWLAVIPFEMTDMRLRGAPAIPGLARTLELNVRTYVRRGSVPGVWFFSLDAESRLAVMGARRLYHLNYLYARMDIERTNDGVSLYTCRRVHRGAPPAKFSAGYRPTGAPRPSEPGSLEHWLTERYVLFSTDRRGRLYRGDIHHAPWLLQPAKADIAINTMTEQLGVTLPAARPILHFAKPLDVLVWTLEPMA